ncbi:MULTISPECIES: response regulator [unclassified Paenibacillus]|uniref:response regulator n=1 Tax=unclassified Paenibacillus TaxID=185978 RepID=UPI003635AA0F
MLKAVLIDDEEIALDVLEIVLDEVGGVSVERKFLQVDEAFAYLEDTEVDLIFLDIEMPGMNGLIAAERLSLSCPGSQIIFVTAYQEYAVEAFEVNAFGYLLKPVSKERLAKTLERYQYRFRQREQAQSKPIRSSAEEELEPVGETEETSLHLNVLGSMELYDSDHSLVTWRTKKAKEMFAYLWHYDGNPVQRNRILEDMWPEHTLDRSQALFHTTLYHLRNTLKNAGFQDAVMFGDERYWMRIEGIVSDKSQLGALMHYKDGDLSVVGELVKLYRGDYLESENYAWAAARRYEIRAAYLQSLQQLLPLAGRLERESILRKLIMLEPYTEVHYRLLLKDLKEAGEGAAARNLHNLMVDRFRNELGIEISLE